MTNNEKLYDGQTALVTGASRGIGKAVTERLSELGSKVITVSTNNELKMVVSDEHYGVDFLDQVAMEDFIQKISLKDIDIVINNAGINKISPFSEIDLDDYTKIQTINSVAPFRIIKAVLPGMQKRRYGRIVNISSIFGVVSKKFRAAYSASKFSLVGMTTSLALEVAKDNIIANCVSPGFINTELTANVLGIDGMNKIAQEVPAERLGEPEEIAEFVGWIASKKNTYLIGQNIVIDGGFTRG